jgi:ribonuclease VapC
MTVVLDASALLAWLQGEPGSDAVGAHLSDSAVCAANWSETWQKLAGRGVDADRATRRLRALGVRVEALTADDALAAARLWSDTRAAGLSLGDRCCLALAQRLAAVAVTADAAWARVDAGVQIELIR